MKKVLIVDDPELVRRVLSQILNAAPELEVVGTAADPYRARKKNQDIKPGCDYPQCGDAAHGRHYVSQQSDAFVARANR